jgi:hypothetical protein
MHAGIVNYDDVQDIVPTKRVRFYNGTGSAVTLKNGYAVCYDISETDITIATKVVQPATANLKQFAGIIVNLHQPQSVADTKYVTIDIAIPAPHGPVVPVWISEDHSANSALLEVTDGTFVLLEGATTKVALSVQLVNRSVTNGTCLAKLHGVSDPLA